MQYQNIIVPSYPNHTVTTKTMKTQINHLRSGNKNQVLNNEVDYSLLPKASSHVGHSGTNQVEASKIWSKVYEENKEEMSITLFGETLKLKANWSGSGKSVSYLGSISNSFLSNFLITASKEQTSSLSISGGTIVVSNGRNSYRSICPSLVTING